MIFNYQEICEDLLDELSPKTKDVLVRRFGLANNKRQTLQAIGEGYGVTRERVRQIETAGLSKIRRGIKRHRSVFEFFSNQLESSGRLRKEDSLFEVLSPGQPKDHVFFLLFLADDLARHLEDRDFYTLWTMDNHSLKAAEDIIVKISRQLKRRKKPIENEEIKSLLEVEPSILFSSLEISKKVNKGPQGMWGLNSWPEIHPRGIRDKALIILKGEKRPLHFRDVARLIKESGMVDSSKEVYSQTVHNELIKDPQFVLVGRGIYALSGWGYETGTVKEVIVGILKQSRRALTKEEIVESALKQRLVKENTVLLNLRDKNMFQIDNKGRYKLSSVD